MPLWEYPQNQLTVKLSACFYATPKEPMACTLTHHQQGCLATYSGHVSFEEFLLVVQRIHIQHNYDTMAHVIHDLSAVASLDLNRVNLTTLMSHELGARRTNPTIRLAIISTDPALESLVKAFNTKTRLNMGFFASIQEFMSQRGL